MEYYLLSNRSLELLNPHIQKCFNHTGVKQFELSVPLLSSARTIHPSHHLLSQGKKIVSLRQSRDTGVVFRHNRIFLWDSILIILRIWVFYLGCHLSHPSTLPEKVCRINLGGVGFLEVTDMKSHWKISRSRRVLACWKRLKNITTPPSQISQER